MAIVYVDPATGDDGTGDGSSGNPYASIQGAHDNYGSWSTTSANTIRLANTAADVLSATIAITIATVEAPLVIEGWDNGGSLTATIFRGQTVTCGEIDGNDAVASIFSNEPYLVLRRLKMHSTTSYVVYLGTSSSLLQCEVYNGASRNVWAANNNLVFGCRVHNDTYTAGHANVFLSTGSSVRNTDVFSNDIGIYVSAANASVINCLVHDVRSTGIMIAQDAQTIAKNTVDGLGSDADAVGIDTLNGLYEMATVIDNLVTNFSGASAVGIRDASGAPMAVCGNNGFYNNTTNESLTHTPGWAPANITESGNPYTNAAADDFSLVPGASSNGAALLFNEDPSNPDNIGYWQDHSTGGGGGGTGAGISQGLHTIGNQIP